MLGGILNHHDTLKGSNDLFRNRKYWDRDYVEGVTFGGVYPSYGLLVCYYLIDQRDVLR